MKNLSQARPYAKAIFAIAMQKQQFSGWQDVLSKQEAANLVNMLTERKKLEILPYISAIFKKLVLAHKKILEAKIITTCELSLAQKEKIISALERRYKNKILLQCQVDSELIGGGVIYIDGQVIDGSIRGMLQRLKQIYVKSN